MAKKKLIPKADRDAIVANCLREIEHARNHKEGVIDDWHKNENVLSEDNANKNKNEKREASANVALHKANGFVQTILSKIDTPLSFKYTHQHIGDKKNADLLNALVEVDSEQDNWDFKDLLGKETAIIYGRTIFSYYATENIKGEYEPNLNWVDPYDFLIDPNAGGIDINNARYCGAYNIRLDRSTLEAGKGKQYLLHETREILEGVGNNDESTEEETDKTNRYKAYVDQARNENRELNDPDLFKFWNWYTTYKGERYYVVISETYGKAIRVEKLEDITKSNLWPYWSYAVFPSASVFWTPSYISIARDIFKAQNVSINQMLDNANRINKPQRAIDVGAVLDESELRYKPNGKIRFKAGTNVDQAFKIVDTVSIDTPIAVYDTLENIVQLMSGVTGAVQGVAEEDKVGIYEGNVAATADRFNLLNKSYTNGYKRFAELYKWGVQEHLKQKKAVKLIGVNGVEIENINYKEIKPITDFMVSVQSSTAESQADFRDKREKLQFLGNYVGSGLINDKNVFEMEAEIVGFNQSDIRRLIDTENTYKNDVIAECARDIELLISGKEIEPNEIADIGYLEYLSNYMRDKKENLNLKQFIALRDYFAQVEPIAVRNMVYSVQDQLAAQGNLGMGIEEIPEEGEVLQDQAQYPEQIPEQQLQDAGVQQQLAGDELQSQLGPQQQF